MQLQTNCSALHRVRQQQRWADQGRSQHRADACSVKEHCAVDVMQNACNRTQLWMRVFIALCLLSSLICPCPVTGSPFSRRSDKTVNCDVIIAGGSLASLAAAVSAANHSSSLSVCYLEPTDWPGGQLTASAVPAVDFGPHNRAPVNVARAFASFLFGESMPDGVNLGDCWVSAAALLLALLPLQPAALRCLESAFSRTSPTRTSCSRCCRRCPT